MERMLTIAARETAPASKNAGSVIGKSSMLLVSFSKRHRFCSRIVESRVYLGKVLTVTANTGRAEGRKSVKVEALGRIQLSILHPKN